MLFCFVLNSPLTHNQFIIMFNYQQTEDNRLKIKLILYCLDLFRKIGNQKYYLEPQIMSLAEPVCNCCSTWKKLL